MDDARLFISPVNAHCNKFLLLSRCFLFFFRNAINILIKL